jgi:hypothetical protein
MDLDWDREFEWKSYRGAKKIKDMDDIHIVNVVHYLKKRIEKLPLEFLGGDNYLRDSLHNFTKEMKFRNIPENSLENAPYEFEDGDGNLRLWDYDKNNFIIKTPALRYILEE